MIRSLSIARTLARSAAGRTDPRKSYLQFKHNPIRLGFTAGSMIHSRPPIQGHRHWFAPHWFAALVIGAWPLASLAAAATRALQSRRRARAGLCPRCGYDIRATPTRCPECATLIPDNHH